ncbi:MAG: N-formylglutamate amidohydrolase [Legionellaceae bacterium]|nr:N-formylglutamate amidohydrolase [Legionellaceae bacterium]
MKQTVLVVSCEHAVNTVPPDFNYVFLQHQSLLSNYQASDLGAARIAQQISNELGCDLTQSGVTRLLIDCNRSLSHSRCFSKFTKSLSNTEKKLLINQYYLPFRQQTKDIIDSHIAANKQVLHLSVHTFAPLLKGFRHNAGIGLLYDSLRHGEKEVARLWHGLLLQETPTYRVRLNYPFPGNSDSFTKTLRSHYTQRDYLGIEMDINQALLISPAAESEVAYALSHSLEELLQLL